MKSLRDIVSEIDLEIESKLKEYKSTRSQYLDGYIDGMDWVLGIVNDALPEDEEPGQGRTL